MPSVRCDNFECPLNSDGYCSSDTEIWLNGSGKCESYQVELEAQRQASNEG